MAVETEKECSETTEEEKKRREREIATGLMAGTHRTSCDRYDREQCEKDDSWFILFLEEVTYFYIFIGEKVLIALSNLGIFETRNQSGFNIFDLWPLKLGILSVFFLYGSPNLM